MELNDFKIRQVIFEIRYNSAYILWDRAGVLARELSLLWPGLELLEGEPNQQVFNCGNARISTKIDNAHIAITAPRSITQYAEQIEESVKLWTDLLELEKYTRVGTRTIFAKTFESADAVNAAAVSLRLLRSPNPPFFNHKSPYSSYQLKMYWDDEDSQTQISIRPEHQVMEISGFFVADDEVKETRTSDALILDIDRAAKGEIDISKFRTSEWLEGVRHLINRDINRFLKVE